MSGLTTVVDTLAAKLSQRIDLVPLKPAVEIVGPEAVTRTEKVSNDTWLPSRAAMLLQLGPELVNARGAGAPHDPHSSANIKFSALARAISTILGPTPGTASAVRGTAPVWALPTPPVPQQLAAVLARTVAASGLFYESHLSQFASGARTLTELAQEPQARLGPPGPLGTLAQADLELVNNRAAQLAPAAPAASALLASPGAPAAPAAPPLAPAVSAQPANPNAPAAPAAAGPAALPVIAPLAGADAMPSVAAAAAASTPAAAAAASTSATNSADVAGLPGTNQPGKAPPDAALQNAGVSHRPTAASVAAAYGVTGSTSVNGSANLPQAPLQSTAATDLDSSMRAIVPDAIRAGSQVAAAIHPDAVLLVRQQLELLAQPVFRWSGEVWPGTQMDWELSEEHRNQQEGAETQAAARNWKTRLTLTLPTLGAIEVRLSLTDTQLQAHLAAGDEASIALLRNDGDDLRQRFTAAGLQLTGLQVAPLLPSEG